MMPEFSGLCPICGDHMAVTRLQCPSCHSTLEGTFTLTSAASLAQTRLERLTRDQLEFVEAFVRCRGIIKNVEDMLGISYPTVKARLNAVIAAMGFNPEEEQPRADARRSRREVLADLAQGKITTDEAQELLKRLG
jgi:hypothetical protein